MKIIYANTRALVYSLSRNRRGLVSARDDGLNVGLRSRQCKQIRPVDLLFFFVATKARLSETARRCL